MEVPVQFHELLHESGLPYNLKGAADASLAGIQEDSRLIRPGDLFLARIGTKTDGAQFIDDARQRGAVAVVASKQVANSSLPTVVIEHSAAASILANTFYKRPSGSVRVLGITGTNGKTTTTYLLRHMLATIGVRCGVIGTVEIDDGKTRREAQMTTPGAVEVARLLADMRDNGCQACAIETSSHALDQDRVAGVRFAAGAFTNLTGDHLDYHQNDMNHYAAAKARLFEMLPADAPACVNIASDWSSRMTRETRGRIIHWGIGEDADYRARDIAITANGSHFILVGPDGQSEIRMPLIGKFNIENALCAASMLAETFGMSVHQIAAALSNALGAPGRLQSVRAGQPFAVLVDYAHTDDALENVLNALRPLTRGKLRLLFGCGGDRDRTKRPRMAKIAAALADGVYVTSDNPRTENPQAIIDEIMSGFPADKVKTVVVEPDRRRAIERAVGDADSNDVVLLAGKGHENYQIIGTTKHHFDDVEEASNVIRRMVKVA